MHGVSGSRPPVVRIWLSLTTVVLIAAANAAATASAADTATDSAAAVEQLRQYLAVPPDQRPPLDEQTFASAALSNDDAQQARALLSTDLLAQMRRQREPEMKARELTHDGKKMRFFYQAFGEKPATGRSLYISLHGGGGTAPRVNDQQWENQKRLYRPEEGIYVAPRAPTNTWNLWHQAHMDPLLIRLIENMVAFEDVDWNRVYIMGYSAGGDGVYQLAPRMADRWAAAAMMAGHPNETSPLGLRNVPFVLQVGALDSGFDRNKIAAQWQDKLGRLHQADPQGYQHLVKIYPGKGHWMDREDAMAVGWMAKYRRNPTPQKIVWKQDDVTHADFYWLGVDDASLSAGAELTASVAGQQITLTSTDVGQLRVYLDDRFIDLDQPIRIVHDGTVLHDAVVTRSIATLSESLTRRSDPNLSFPSKLTLTLP